MSEQPSIRSPLLPIVLLIGVIFGLIFVAIRATRALPEFEGVPTIPPSPLAPTQSLTPTSHLSETPTPQPTWTIRPSATPTNTATATSTPTATLYPTLPVANPLQFNDLYRLRRWKPEQAQQMVDLLNDYPLARFRTTQERQEPQFNEAFTYPAIALREALLRFPDDPAAEAWKWDLAYSLARSNDPEAGNIYAQLIDEALESGEARINRLPEWFAEQEQRLELNVYSITTESQTRSNQVVHISGGGGAYIWVLDNSGDFTTQLLVSHFDFASNLESGLATGDFTGDGDAEAVIFFSQSAENSLLTPARVFNLTGKSPIELPFVPSLPFDLGTEFSGSWHIGDLEGLLQFSTRILPACPVDITRSYAWNGEAFELVDTYFQLEQDPAIVEYCEITVEHAARLWGHEVSAEFMEAVLPHWPPERRVDGRLYRPEARDEWMYRLGVSHALVGNLEQARIYLQEIIDQPAQADSPWIEHAQNFLEVYRSQEDLYYACIQSVTCDTRAAMAYITARIPVERYTQVHVELRSLGVVLRSSGTFDFEGDGEPERWFIVRPRENQNLELWILASDSERIHALFVEDIDNPSPSFRYSDQETEPPIVQHQLGEGFKLERLPGSGEPFITYHRVKFVPTTFTLEALEEAINDLFSGEDPAEVLKALENLGESERFNCLNFRICDRYDYILGLAYELTGREREAIDTYVKLWWENRNSPFTAMARLKLEPLTRTTPTTTPRTSTPGAYPPPAATPTGGYPAPPPTPTFAYPSP